MNHIDRPFGSGIQRTYYKDDGVIWKDLIVHIGAKPPTRVTAATFIVPKFDPENPRASTRAYRAAAPYRGNDDYYKDDAVIWKDLIVHIGAKPPTKVTAATFIVPVFDPENKRASTRVFRADAPYTGNDKWYKGSLCTNARSLGAWNPAG